MLARRTCDLGRNGCVADASVPAGPGVCRFANGDRYTGSWEADLQAGQGFCLYAGGGKYRGEWRQGLRHGQGTCTFAGGDTYTGAVPGPVWPSCCSCSAATGAVGCLSPAQLGLLAWCSR